MALKCWLGNASSAGFIEGSALQHRGPAVPAPRHAEARERLWQYRLLQCRLRPAFSSIGRNHDLGDAAGTRIGDAGNLVVTRLLQHVSVRRCRDEGLDLLQEIEAVGFPVRQDLRISARLVVAHRGFRGELESPQIFDVHVAFVAGQPQPHRITLFRLDALSILVERDHCVIQRLGDRNAAAQMRRIGALGDDPLRRRVNAGLLKQRR